MVETHRKQWGIALCNFANVIQITFSFKRAMLFYNRSTIFMA